jgi:hypothetical protein
MSTSSKEQKTAQKKVAKELSDTVESICVQMVLSCRMDGQTQAMLRQSIADNGAGSIATFIRGITVDPEITALFLVVFAAVNERIP